MSLTYKSVQAQLRAVGVVISKRGEVHRINFFGGIEETAYQTDSLEDALDQGLKMAGAPRSRITLTDRLGPPALLGTNQSAASFSCAPVGH